MGWKPDMTDAQRKALNRSRRKAYAKKQLKAGRLYSPRRPDDAPEDHPVASDNSLSRLKELLEKAEKKQNNAQDGDNSNNQDRR